MPFYAHRPGRFARQVITDVLVVCWILAAVAVPTAVGVALWQVGNRITAVAGQTTTAAGQLRSSAATAATVPFIGSDIATPLRTVATALTSLDSRLAGATTSVHRAAILYPVAAGLLAIIAPMVVWWLTRGRWITATRRLRGPLSQDDLQALACAAAATSSLRTLRQLPPGTLTAWAAGDPAARVDLASLQLRTLGLSPPHLTPTPSASLPPR